MAVGDQCLVKTWTLTKETIAISSGTYQVAMSGLAGTTLVITADSTQTINYDHSAPLNVSNSQNSTTQILTYSGQVVFHSKASGGVLVSTVISSTAAFSVATAGAPASSPAPLFADISTASYPPTSYTCTATSLTMHQPTPVGPREDTWIAA